MKVLNSTSRSKQQGIPNRTAQAHSIKHLCVKYGPPAIWIHSRFFTWMLSVQDTDCILAWWQHQVYLEIENNGLLFLPLNKKTTYKSIHTYAHTRKHSSFFSTSLSITALSPSLNLLSELSVLTVLHSPPLFSPEHSSITTDPLKSFFSWLLTIST